MTPEQTITFLNTAARNIDFEGPWDDFDLQGGLAAICLAPDMAAHIVAQREQIAALEKQVQAAEHFAACHDAHDALDENDMDLRIDAYALVVSAKASLRAMGEQT
jgi:hypothetical protein